MHSHSFDISIKNFSKIEGHASLDIKVRDKKVKQARFSITENKRFYEEAARGQSYESAPQLMSRICGTCSIAHLVCCIEALEKALGVTPTEQAVLLKKLTMYGLMVRDHALHLYLFSLPDVFGKDSILDFDEKNELEHKLLHDTFAVKKAGNNLCTLVAGKAVHAPFPTVGGFLSTPDKAQAKQVAKDLLGVRQSVLDLIKIYFDWDARFERKTSFVALKTDDFSFLNGKICSSQGHCIEEQNYINHLKKVVIPYSTATGFNFEGKNYMVGSLARLNISKENIHRDTLRDAKNFLARFPSQNIFDNNLAQAIEVLHSIDHSVEILSNTDFVEEEPQQITPRAGVGVGVIEAPRGTLYYNVATDGSGIIKNANVIVPTQQNQINIENDIRLLVEQMISKNAKKEKIVLEIEKLVRAYDPCMSCASHFLKVNWI